ncbi:MAG: hypothetical protein R3C68_04485 [Myxococcota bacterium]
MASLVFLSTIASVAGCSGELPKSMRSTQVDAGVEAPPAITNFAFGTRLITVIDHKQVNISETVTIRCFIDDGRDRLIQIPYVGHRRFSDPGPMQTVGTNTQFNTTLAGRYSAACQAADGSIIDPLRSTSRVLPAPAVSWAVSLPHRVTLYRSDRLRPDVAVYDKYGNRWLDPQVKVILRRRQSLRNPRNRLSFDPKWSLYVDLEHSGEESPGAVF